jgi:hypothetical protein
VLRRLLAIACAGLVSAVVALIGGGPAAAGGGYPPCGSLCDGKDPQTFRIYFDPNNHPDHFYTCAGIASTKGRAATDNVSVELRYSTRCETTWARATRTGGVFWDIIHYSKFPSGTMRRTVRNDFVDGASWTTMLNDHGLLNRVCIEDFENEDDYAAGRIHQRACTVWY